MCFDNGLEESQSVASYGLGWIWTVLSCDCFIIKTLKQPFNLFWINFWQITYRTDWGVLEEHMCWSELLFFFLKKKKNGLFGLIFYVCAFHSEQKMSTFFSCGCKQWCMLYPALNYWLNGWISSSCPVEEIGARSTRNVGVYLEIPHLGCSSCLQCSHLQFHTALSP